MTPEEFANEFSQEFADQPAPQNSPYGPYGGPVQPVKTGLTRRGKAALAIGATVIASGGMLTWQHYSAQADANQVKAQELSLQQQQLELEKLKVISEANAKNAKVQATQDAARNKQIDACVDANKGLIGKQMGVNYQSVREDCQAQYGTNAGTGADMQEAASAADSNASGGISPSALIGIVAGGALLVGVAASRGRRNNPA